MKKRLRDPGVYPIATKLTLKSLLGGRCAACGEQLNNKDVLQVCSECMPDDDSRVICKNSLHKLPIIHVVKEFAREAHPNISISEFVSKRRPTAFIVNACNVCDSHLKFKKVTCIPIYLDKT